MDIQGNIKLLKNNQVDANGIAIAPLASELEFGQIAVNYSALNPSLFFKDTNGKVVKVVSEEVIADTLADILGGSAADLSTLKELLDAFATSDIATVQADIVSRLSAVESGKVDKVSGKGLSTNDYTTTEKNKLAGIGSGANVTSVAGKTGVVTLTKNDVGLSNVRNVEQLGKTETAADSSKLGGYSLDNFIYGSDTGGSINASDYNFEETVKSGFFKVFENNNSSGLPNNNTGWGLHINWQPNNKAGTTLFTQDGVAQPLMIRTQDGAGGGKWRTMYDSGNANKSDIDWTTCRLNLHNGIFGVNNQQIINQDENNNVYLNNPNGGLTYIEGQNDNCALINNKIIWNAGNSNKSTIDWSANAILTNRIHAVNSDETVLWANNDSHIRRLQLYNAKHSAGIQSVGGNLQLLYSGANIGASIVSGNFGIGTETPSEKLHVNGKLRVSDGANGVTFHPHYGGIDIVSTGNLAPHYKTSFTVYKGDSSSGIPTMHIDTNMFVGIGTMAPTEKLDVNGNGLFNGNVTAKGDVVAYSSTSNVYIEPLAGAGNLFDLGDVELPSTLTNNYVLAYDAGKKKWTAKESVGTGGANVDYTRLSNVPTAFTPKAHNHEDATYVSDARLKQNINPLDNALSTVLNLNAKSFGWTTEAKERYNMKDEVSYGYIAQDVEKIIPDIVKELETGDGYIGVEYIKVIPFITEAIKQLHNNTIESNLNLKKELNKMNKVYSTLFNDYKQLKEEMTKLKQKH